MHISVELPAGFLNEREEHRLMEVLRADDEAGLTRALEKVARASLAEYRDMFIGTGLATRGDDVQQRRLYYLIKHYFGRLPTEADVSALFQLTASRSRNLINAVITRFRHDLEVEIRRSLAETLQAAHLNDDTHNYRVAIQGDNILAELNRIIAARAPHLDPVSRVRNMARTYAIAEDTYDVLNEYIGSG